VRESDGVPEYGGDDGRGCWRQRECHSGGVCEYGSVCVHDPCPTRARVRRGRRPQVLEPPRVPERLRNLAQRVSKCGGDAGGVRKCAGRCESDGVYESSGVRKSGACPKTVAGVKSTAGYACVSRAHVRRGRRWRV
jgi:hypothetical protein